MHGNVWEWCEDIWQTNYEGAPSDGSVWGSGEKASRVVLRGGSWNLKPRHCRAAFRNRYPPDSLSGYVGFRVCCGAPIETMEAGTRITE